MLGIGSDSTQSLIAELYGSRRDCECNVKELTLAKMVIISIGKSREFYRFQLSAKSQRQYCKFYTHPLETFGDVSRTVCGLLVGIAIKLRMTDRDQPTWYITKGSKESMISQP